ncbi:hypothetical protein HMPREF0454_03448 [Hafnia alvei ATCC 51873]|uniref:Uncharacterized protein n=1 Tax=Hafnia alvei ATCC 51873 TaxID=1002364 RepID=G9YA29_HAFAL|nr:hypothetical protein HMPREF0454_03448 [Hafnia alvei ATCC 51873]
MSTFSDGAVKKRAKYIGEPRIILILIACVNVFLFKNTYILCC